MEAVVGIEGQHFVSYRDGVVVSEFGYWEQSGPVVLFPVHEGAKVSLDRLIQAFLSPVRLQVESCGYSGTNFGES